MTDTPPPTAVNYQDEPLFWAVRTFVYQRFAQTTQPPTLNQTAAHFGVSAEQVARLYTALDAEHAFFLEPGSMEIRMANPFSAVPTDFRVHIADKIYWANCAWDALGIPAALHADATIEACYAGSEDPLHIGVQAGTLLGQAREETVAHLLVPFHRWYENMNFT